MKENIPYNIRRVISLGESIMAAIRHDLEQLFEMLEEIEHYDHLSKILNYDMETSAPKGGMDDDAKDLVRVQSQLFKLKKDPDYLYNVQRLYKVGFPTLENEWEKRLVILLKRDLEQSKGVSPKLNKEANELFSNAYITWLKAKENHSFDEFKETLAKIVDMESRIVQARFPEKNQEEFYDVLLSDYEYGFSTADLDAFFEEIENAIVPLYKAVKKANYVPRHDFLSRRIPLNKQEEFSRYLLTFNQFDFSRGSMATTEHPFTEQFGKDDVRVTTKYYEDNFLSNMYSIIHEGGHALFGQNVPEEIFSYHLSEGSLSMAKHESVSRLYENVIGRSKEYIHAIYPKFHELFKEELGDVSEADLYEGVNYIDTKNMLRTEADELTYPLHIIIRYKLEKEMMKGNMDFNTINDQWKKLYKDYLDVDVTDDAKGILSDVHWTSGFGYFPTYAMGNAMNVMYTTVMDEEIHVSKTVKAGKMDKILDWLKKNVFAQAPLLDTKDWIKKITGEEFSAKAYCDYLTNKFSKLYHLTKTDIKNATKEVEKAKKKKEA